MNDNVHSFANLTTSLIILKNQCICKISCYNIIARKCLWKIETIIRYVISELRSPAKEEWYSSNILI